MATGETYDFQAPQFIESLSNIEEADDGADNFFDAVEVTSANEPINENKIIPASPAVDKKSCLEETSNKENQESSSAKKIRRESRLTRMSLKKVNSPLRKSARFKSLAEQVHNFHHATPPRFKRKSGVVNSRCKLLPTVAHSPLLQTKLRARQSIMPTIVTEERPVFKPVKVPKMKVKPPPKPAPRPATVPKPFNLTDPNRFKKMQKQENKNVDSSSTTKNNNRPQTADGKPVRKPANFKRAKLAIVGGELVVQEKWAISGMKTLDKPNATTKIVPFSFEKRNEERLKAKQMKKEEEAKESKPAVKTPKITKKKP